MQQFQGFQFHSASHGLGFIDDIHFEGGSYDRTHEYGKPVQVFHTKGLQVIGVPPQLQEILRNEDILRANAVTTSISCHFETEKCFYLLRVESACHMALPR